MASDKLLAEWFWTDRWAGSSAFLLPLEARGLYREMLTQAWRRGGKLPNDPETIQRAVGATAAEWTRAWPKVRRYWRVDGNDLVNDTQLEVYAASKALSDKRAEAGRIGATQRWQSHRQQHKQSHRQPQWQSVCSPSLSLQEERTNTRSSRSALQDSAENRPAADFDRFWSAYPNRKAKGAALKAWQKLKPQNGLVEKILDAIQRQRRWPDWTKESGKFIPHPASWLNAHRWEDQRLDVVAPRSDSTCTHDPACESFQACTRRTINDHRRAAGKPLLAEPL